MDAANASEQETSVSLRLSPRAVLLVRAVGWALLGTNAGRLPSNIVDAFGRFMPVAKAKAGGIGMLFKLNPIDAKEVLVVLYSLAVIGMVLVGWLMAAHPRVVLRLLVHRSAT